MVAGKDAPRMNLLVRNGALGGVFTLNLPAKLSCPGSTASCRACCYASKGRFSIARNKKLLAERLDHLKEELKQGGVTGLAKVLQQGLLRGGTGPIRIHSSGDFWDPRYLIATALAIRAIREDFGIPLVCYAYSRTWRLGQDWMDAWHTAVEVADGGLRLWASTDAETGDPWSLVGWPLVANICGVTPGVGDEACNCIKQLHHVPGLRRPAPEHGCPGCRRCYDVAELTRSLGHRGDVPSLPLAVNFLRH